MMSGSVELRVLIVDDEALARSSLALLLKRDVDVRDLWECDSTDAAILSVSQNRPNLLFLDVQMPERDGFDVVEALGSNLPPAVVFVTAYDEFALRAFDAGAIDYLLKPFDDARFARMLARVKERLRQTPSRPHLDRFAIKEKGQVLFVRAEEIDWIEAADYYAALHVAGRTYLVRRSMSDLEAELDPAIFCRVHRSAIVNIERVRGLEWSDQGDSQVVLTNDTRLKLSRAYRKALQSRLLSPRQSANA